MSLNEQNRRRFPNTEFEGARSVYLGVNLAGSVFVNTDPVNLEGAGNHDDPPLWGR